MGSDLLINPPLYGAHHPASILQQHLGGPGEMAVVAFVGAFEAGEHVASKVESLIGVVEDVGEWGVSVQVGHD